MIIPHKVIEPFGVIGIPHISPDETTAAAIVRALEYIFKMKSAIWDAELRNPMRESNILAEMMEQCARYQGAEDAWAYIRVVSESISSWSKPCGMAFVVEFKLPNEKYAREHVMVYRW